MPDMDMIFMAVIGILCLLAGGLLCAGHFMRYHTVRVYNWNGQRYRFLGRERVYKKNDMFVINMRERIADLSYTTRYCLLASREFVKRHRFAGLLLRAGASEAWLPVEERMVQDIYYRNIGR